MYMKNLFILIGFIIFISCSSKPTVLNFRLKAGLSNKVDSAQILFKERAYNFALNEEGCGSVSIEIEKDGFAQLVYGKLMTDVYLMEGNELTVTWDPQDWRGERIEIVSNDGGVNQYIRHNLEVSFDKASACSFTLPEDEFMNKVDSTILALNIEIDKTKFPSNVKNLLKASVKYEMLCWIYKYPRFHNYGKVMKKEDYKVFTRFNSYMFGQFEEHADYLCLTSYRNYAQAWFYELMQLECHGEPYILKKDKACQYILKHVKNSQVKEFALANTITPYIRSYGIVGAEKLVDYFKRYVNNPLYTKPFDVIYNVWEKILPGKEAFDFNYIDVHGNRIKLSDFKGKYVFIDIWATWCKPCCYEIPFVQKLEHRFKNRNIVFVSISMDKDLNTWREIVQEKHMGGIQLNYERNRDFMNYFFITAIPRFLLIDKERKIINACAPKPSSVELEELLEEILD